VVVQILGTGRLRSKRVVEVLSASVELEEKGPRSASVPLDGEENNQRLWVLEERGDEDGSRTKTAGLYQRVSFRGRGPLPSVVGVLQEQEDF